MFSSKISTYFRFPPQAAHFPEPEVKRSFPGRRKSTTEQTRSGRSRKLDAQKIPANDQNFHLFWLLLRRKWRNSNGQDEIERIAELASQPWIIFVMGNVWIGKFYGDEVWFEGIISCGVWNIIEGFLQWLSWMTACRNLFSRLSRLNNNNAVFIGFLKSGLKLLFEWRNIFFHP